MAEIKQKSLKVNMLLNAIRSLVGIVFPLISFPYVSKILGADALGSYNFANSIVSYILLLAGLGIETYAIREGARIRENTEQFSKFANEIFTINTISTVCSYVFLLVLLFFVPQLYEYRLLILIFSLQVLFTVVGINWVYSIYEDFAYITIRSVIFQFLSILLMFLIVKTPDDVELYACITVFASVGANILNFFHASKYCKVRLTLKIHWKQHIKPILMLFAMAATVTIYVSSDTTILGFICGDHTVGIYAVSVKIYTILKSLLSSVIVVSIPRLASMLSENKRKEFCLEANNIFSMLLTVLLPSVVGVIVLSREIILLISDETFISAQTSLVILSVTMFFCLGAGFFGQAILVPLQKEKTVVKATVLAAIVNIVLNFILIPYWAENAAALTTLIAEGVAFVWCLLASRKYVKLKGIFKLIIKIVVGCISIVAIAILLRMFIDNMIVYVVLTVGLAIVTYAVIEIILKNKTVTEIYASVKRKFFQKNNA